MEHKVQTDLHGRTLEIETGKLAQQANGAVTVRYGDTVVLVTACMAGEPKEGVDFMPLTIEVIEKFYAVGRLPGGFFRREAKPSTDATLAARLCDRPLRPLFPKNFHNETQVIISVLSAETAAPYPVLGIIGASAALAISDIPFDDPVGACVIGKVDGKLVVNPSYEQLAESKIDLTVAGTSESIMMVEAGSEFASEEEFLDALKLSQEVNAQIVNIIRELQSAVGKDKKAPPETAPEVVAVEQAVSSAVGDKLTKIQLAGGDKATRKEATAQVKAEVVEALAEHEPEVVAACFGALEKQTIRTAILNDSIRPDGRDLEEIRQLGSYVGLLPRVHGSAIFERGETQILNAVTLASLGDKQRLDTFAIDTEKFFIHHYNFPPYSTGEARRMGVTGRREIGHGALAERALKPIVPSTDDFPYTIRSVSEALSSNGSTSMASVCSGCLALMDAGVPIKEMVAGIAMGLITDDSGKYVVLTDIQGAEDHIGDMDFKVAGSKNGITALQMDIKVKGITFEIMQDALAKAKDARLRVLNHMEGTLSAPRATVSKYAPSVTKITIPTEKIGAVIGSGGATIRKLTEENNVAIDIDEAGVVTITAENGEAAEHVVKLIEMITSDLEVGTKYKGTVVRIVNFGAFVQIVPGKEGLVHISEISEQRVPDVESVVSLGDEVEVLVVNVDHMGRVDLSMRAIDELDDGAQALSRFKDKERRQGGGGGGFGGGRRNNDGGGFRGGGGRDRDRDRDSRRGGRQPFGKSDGNRRPESFR